MSLRAGWPCRGQTLPLAQNAALYSLLGTNFGGDGMTNFKNGELLEATGSAPARMSSALGRDDRTRQTLPAASLRPGPALLVRSRTGAGSLDRFRGGRRPSGDG